MKTKIHLIVIILIFILFIPSITSSLPIDMSDSHPSQAGVIWEEMEHDFIREDVMPYDIAFMNITHGWALSQNETSFGDGIILHTNDSGYSWYLQHHNDTQWFTQIEFVGKVVWVTARQGLLYSVNFGTTWNFLPLGSELDAFRSIHFFNDTLGWAGSNIGVYKTDDGGVTWQQASRWRFGGNPRGIHFINPQDGWILGSEGIYHTSDGGEIWVMRHNRGGWNFFFISDTEAWAVGDSMLTHMVDGATWVEQPLPEDSYNRPPYMSDVQFLNQTHGWIGSLRPQIAHTQNGGIDWYEQSVSRETSIMAVYFINESLGWAIGWDGYIFRTTRANELGAHSWSTSSPTDIYTVVAITVTIGSLGLLLLIKKRRNNTLPPTQSSSDPLLE
ncbi:MAG: YCF48-related protein [Candidatus Thorarchaeota archaeon]